MSTPKIPSPAQVVDALEEMPAEERKSAVKSIPPSLTGAVLTESFSPERLREAAIAHAKTPEEAESLRRLPIGCGSTVPVEMLPEDAEPNPKLPPEAQDRFRRRLPEHHARKNGTE